MKLPTNRPMSSTASLNFPFKKTIRYARNAARANVGKNESGTTQAVPLNRRCSLVALDTPIHNTRRILEYNLALVLVLAMESFQRVDCRAIAMGAGLWGI